MTPRQKLCRAQLNKTTQAKSLWHSLTRASKENDSWRTQCMRANDPLSPLMPQLSCSTSPLGMKGMWAAWEGGSRLEVRVTTGLIRVTCQGWNPSAHAGQWLPRCFCSSPPLSRSVSLLPLTSLTCLEWVQMCDPQTLPLRSPYWTQRAQQRLTHRLKSSWPKCHCTMSHHLQAIVWGWQRGATAKRRTFNHSEWPDGTQFNSSQNNKYGNLIIHTITCTKRNEFKRLFYTHIEVIRRKT